MEAKSVVAIVRGLGPLEDGDIDRMVREVVILSGGLGGIVRKGGTVLIKPNLVAPMAPERGATTDPRVCRSLADQVRELGGRAVIAESSAIGVDTEEAFKVCGYDALRVQGYEVVDLKKAALVTVSVPMGTVLKELKLPQLALQADAIISVPKLKTHDQSIATLALKNMKGLVPDTLKKQFHTTFGVFRAVAELNTVVKPALSIVDALVAQEGLGPVFGTPVTMGLLVAGRDPVAVDTVAGLIMGIEPQELEVSKHASELGLGAMDMDRIEVVGVAIDSVKRRFKRAAEALEETLHLPDGLELIFNEMACTGCRTGVLSSLWDLAEEGQMGVLRDTRIVAGMMEAPPLPSLKRTIYVGACASKFRYQSEFVKGCPPNNVDIRACITGVTPEKFFVEQ
jgi:uncharacterized protein (DUF362 family)